MQDVIKGPPDNNPPRLFEPLGQCRCVRCEKPLRDEKGDVQRVEGPICFWCAYVEPQG